MSSTKRTATAFLLCAVLILTLFAGCGSSQSTETDAAATEADTSAETVSEESEEVSEEPSEEASQEASTEPSEETEEQASAEPSADTASETEAEPVESAISFPLDETQTFTVWFDFPEIVLQFCDGVESIVPYQKMEEMTNVHLEFQIASAEQETKFNLMIVSGEYTDLISSAMSYWTDGVDMAVEENVFVDLTPYLEEYAPNYYAQIHSNDQYLRELVSDGGYIGEFAYLYETAEGENAGQLVRADWMEELGLEIPTTYADWETVLKAFQSEYGCTNAVWTADSGVPVIFANDGFSDYVVTGSQDGTATYYYTTDLYREQMEYVARWYEEGLFTQDFLSASDDIPEADVINGNCGVWNGNVQDLQTYFDNAADENFDMVPFQMATLDGSDDGYVKKVAAMTGATGWAVSTCCENVELACAYMDCYYTEEGYILCNYGVEGEGLYYDENGEPRMSDLILNNPDIPVAFSQTIYALKSGAFVYATDKWFATYTDLGQQAYEAWNSRTSGDTWQYNTSLYTMDADASAEYSGLMDDISTYVDEAHLKFVKGAMDITDDAVWDAYVAEIEAMGISRCTELMQNALDQYYSCA